MSGPDFLVGEAVDQGAQMGLGGMARPFGFPGGESLVPHDRQRPALSRGLPVLDVHGDRIGEIHDCAVSPETRRPTLLTIRGGLGVFHAHPVQASLIQDISADGVVLSVGKDQLA